MRYAQTYLMTAGELHMAAAAGGMKNLLMFKAEEEIDRAQQIQAIFRMVNEGFLINENGTLKAGAPLVPLLNVFRRSTYAIVAKKPGRDAAPVCIYRGGQNFLCVAPHQQGVGLYEVSFFDSDALLDDLEARGLLPAAHEELNPNAEEFDGGIYERIKALGEQWSNQMVCDVFADELLSFYEQYRLSDQASIDKLLILKAPFAWCTIERSAHSVGPTAYSRGTVGAWLKGGDQ